MKSAKRNLLEQTMKLLTKQAYRVRYVPHEITEDEFSLWRNDSLFQKMIKGIEEMDWKTAEKKKENQVRLILNFLSR